MNRKSATLEEKRRGFPKLIDALVMSQTRDSDASRRLRRLCEDEAEWMMYLSEPDGCLPQIDGVKRRFNIRSSMYRASRVFGRGDFRFAVVGGMTMQDVCPPRTTDLIDQESGIYVFRNT